MIWSIFSLDIDRRYFVTWTHWIFRLFITGKWCHILPIHSLSSIMITSTTIRSIFLKTIFLHQSCDCVKFPFIHLLFWWLFAQIWINLHQARIHVDVVASIFFFCWQCKWMGMNLEWQSILTNTNLGNFFFLF